MKNEKIDKEQTMNNLEEFKNWLVLNKDKKTTITGYYNNLKHFFRLYPEFNQQNINDFFKVKLEKGCKENTLNKYYSAFCSYIEYSKINIDLPKRKKIPNVIRPYINEIELNDICIKLNILTNDYDKWSLMLKVMFYTGMRENEIIKLKRQDINLEEKTIIVRKPKNNKERVIAFSNEFKKLITNYFNSNPEQFNAFNIKLSTLQYMCRVISKNFNMEFYPHLLRRSACHYFLKITDNNIYAVTYIMGHSSVEQTMAYAQLSQKDTIKVMQEGFKKYKK